MPAGERNQVWYRELVALLRTEWRPDLSWEAIVDLRERLQRELEALRASRGIKPPVMRCPRCATIGPAAPPSISVRAMLLALARFGIEPGDLVRQRERAWAKHCAEHALDPLGGAAHSDARLHKH